ncbi:MAG: TatD family deoxyribonuclease [Microbacteriaceae bacterium]|nr:TatD family deoxyribonuclease [Microbacteriaceae bacterium]
MSEDAPIRSRTDRSEDGSTRDLRYPPLPEPLEVGTYDNHTHFDFADGENPLTPTEQLDLANEAGILGVVQVGVTLESSKWSARLAAKEPRVLAAVALHPNEAPLYESQEKLEAAIAEIEQLASQPRVRAIGETGLDFFRTEGDGSLRLQQFSFEEHIRIAKDNDIALMIHDREAHDEVAETLKRLGAPNRVVMHCYSGDVEFAKICAAQGWFMSFAGNITIKRNQHLRDALAFAPAELLLVETDAPFLTPEPFRGRPNASYLTPITVRKMAEVRGVDANDLAAQLTANTELVYGSWSEGL